MKEISVYVAGPLYSSGDLVNNTRAAIDAAQKLEQAKLEGVVFRPFVPHVYVQTWQLVYQRAHELAQEWDDYWLRKCDLMLRLPGLSVGSDHEEGIAVRHNIPVFYTINAVLCYARFSEAVAAYRKARAAAFVVR